MKKRGFLSVSLAIVVLFFLAGCASESKFWKEVSARNSERAYDQYLVKYPKGRYVGDAKAAREKIIEKREFDRAIELKNENAYREFIYSNLLYFNIL